MEPEKERKIREEEFYKGLVIREITLEEARLEAFKYLQGENGF